MSAPFTPQNDHVISRVSWRTVLVAGGAILLVKASLAAVGLPRTWRWIRERAERGRPRPRIIVDVARTEYLVALAAALYPGRALCLERSLVLYWLLRRRGVLVAFRMGVQLYPFLAHAWIEHEGRVINDVEEHVALFQPIPEIPS